MYVNLAILLPIAKFAKLRYFRDNKVRIHSVYYTYMYMYVNDFSLQKTWQITATCINTSKMRGISIGLSLFYRMCMLELDLHCM